MTAVRTDRCGVLDLILILAVDGSGQGSSEEEVITNGRIFNIMHPVDVFLVELETTGKAPGGCAASWIMLAPGQKVRDAIAPRTWR
jgi:hypothetical protein